MKKEFRSFIGDEKKLKYKHYRIDIIVPVKPYKRDCILYIYSILLTMKQYEIWFDS